MTPFDDHSDPLDGIMQVMEAAFDPEYGEAWNRKQVSDTLILPNTRFYLATSENQIISSNDLAPKSFQIADAIGFAMTRHVADEEELLLIGVIPSQRNGGIGTNILRAVINKSREHGICKLFLEMRDGNPAEILYRNLGFKLVGRRKAYYRRGRSAPLDSTTFSKEL